MSVLIKDMKMPKNCGECKFCRMTYTQYGEIFSADCTIKDFPIKWSELDLRDGLCPLIELQPHGRLIDADALNYTIKIVFCKDCEFYIKHDKRCAVWNHGVHKDDYCSRGLKKEVKE